MSHPALAAVLRETRARKTSDGWDGRCPAHDDRRASLSIAEHTPGKLLLRCQAGCDYDSVRAAFAGRGIDVRTHREDRAPNRVWTIRDQHGKALAQHARLDEPDGVKRIWWQGPAGEKVGLRKLGLSACDLPLYGIHDLPPGDPVILCEGEKAADALRGLRVAAVGTVTGASKCPSDASLGALKGRRVILWPDADEPGLVHMREISARLSALGIEHVIRPWAGARDKGDDAADFVARGGTAEQLRALHAAPAPSAPVVPEGPRALHAAPPPSAPALPEGPRALHAAPAPSAPVVPEGLRLLADGVKEAAEELDRFEAGDWSSRLSTSIHSLDMRLRGGLAPGQLTLLGAPSGGGKTTLLVQLCVGAARSGPVLLVSPEMGAAELAEREIVRRSGHEVWARNPWGRATSPLKRDAARVAHAHAEVEIASERLPLWVLERSDVTMDDVEAAAASIPGLRLVAIDYAQQVAGTDPRTPRYLQVGDVGTRSVALAQKLRVPVVVASQVNVIREKRGRETVKEFAFRETAILEHKAHNVLILDVEWDSLSEIRFVKQAQVLCTKQRSGPAFQLDVTYVPETYSVTDCRAEQAAAQTGPALAPLPEA